jgi:hypothetical protein
MSNMRDILHTLSVEHVQVKVGVTMSWCRGIHIFEVVVIHQHLHSFVN